MTPRAVKPPAGSAAGSGRLTAQDWAVAAMAAIAQGGLAAVAIEPLATKLGTTKGSFYWHFPHRNALIAAALEQWENYHTEAVIALVQTKAHPRDQLRLLISGVFESTAIDTPLGIELALMASATDPRVAPILARVTERRISFTAELFEKLQVPKPRHRAILAVSAYLGYAQLAHSAPEAIPRTTEDRAAYVEQLLTLISTPYC